jgi:hypothetical protein
VRGKNESRQDTDCGRRHYLSEVTTLLTAINQGEIFKFITKPWKLEEEFKGVIAQAVDYYNLHAERDRLSKELEEMKQKQACVESK